jgi:hypothetical protein
MKPQCPLCEARGHSVVRETVRLASRSKIVECGNCHLIYQSPRPTQEVLDAYYRDGQYEKDYGGYDATSDPGQAWERIQRLKADALLNDHAAVGEVGPGSGAFLDLAGALGFSASEHKPGERYDLVVAFHVLEHTLWPFVELKKWAMTLAPNGRLVVEVPSASDALLTEYDCEAFAVWTYSKAHLQYFTEGTLRRAFCAAGLEVSIRPLQRYGLANHLNWLRNGRTHQGEFRYVVSAEADLAYRESLVRRGCADTLWAVGRVA